ncbi:dUTP diphosphatase [bacterium]|nr:dUTP diphosphatase [bacterium]
MEYLTIKIKLIRGDSCLPRYMTPLASGVDLYASIPETLVIPAGDFIMVPTGIAAEIPPGFEGQVRPRSGLAARNGIGLLNAPGTIDADYRGEIKVILFNFGDTDFPVKPGERIAQLIFSKVYHANFEIVEELDSTERGKGGFGHTGK